MSEVWTKWEGQVVAETFLLRRYLGGSDHSGVFLTEDAKQNLANAALKLVPAVPTLADSQLAHWRAAGGVSHPHLIPIFALGRSQLGSLPCLYVVMEYAEQNLADLLRTRPLTDVEVREMLPPFLDALAFLHSKGLVQGQLKPSNILAVGDRLKLASDTIRPADEATTSLSMSSAYDPPEARDGSFSTAGDVWSLGVTLFEALTQKVPPRPDERGHGVVLPADFPPAWAVVVRECLSRRPVDRPSVKDLQAWISRGLQGSAVSPPASSPSSPSAPPPATPAPSTAEATTTKRSTSLPQSATSLPPTMAAPRATAQAAAGEAQNRLVIRAMVEREEPSQAPLERRSLRSLVPSILGAVVILVLGWGVVHLLWSRSHTHQNAAGASKATVESGNSPIDSARNAQEAVPAPAESSQASQPPAPASNSSRGARKAVAPASSVVHEEMPVVPHKALATIHGHVKVVVRVTVDESGRVVADTLENAGPSRFFAQRAAEAARKWRFSPADDKASRYWRVHFEFARSGVTGHAVSANAGARR